MYDFRLVDTHRTPAYRDASSCTALASEELSTVRRTQNTPLAAVRSIATTNTRWIKQSDEEA